MKHILSHITFGALFTLIFFLFNACATNQLQISETAKQSTAQTSKTVSHTFYLIGDAGKLPENGNNPTLLYLKEKLKESNKNSTVLFLGDNIYPKGMPKKESEDRKKAEDYLNAQIEAVKDFNGNTIFLPGNHDWYNDGLKGLKRQEEFIEERLGKNSFLPENGCPIEKVKINDDVVLLILDSQWYVTDWNKHPTINDNCQIKTRTRFLDELESEIKKARGKTTLIAMHNPIYTNGPHGGQYSFKSHLTPAPILGSIKNLIRKTGGVANVDVTHPRYNELRKFVITLARQNEKVIFASGHEHNLQYIVQDNLPQIVSGSAAKLSPTRNVGGGQFSYSTPGFAKLEVYSDGSSHVEFHSVPDDKIVFQTEVYPPNPEPEAVEYPGFGNTAVSSVYTDEETTKGKTYTKLWGDRYRKYYSTKVEVPTIDLDTLYGGVKVVRKGGGHQSKSLRLEDKNGKQYVMRAIRKQATQYLQTAVFTDKYIGNKFDDGYVEGLLLDAFTGAHPYAPFVIGTLADAVDVYHTNPTLYYIPKQQTLGGYNEEFGDELYMIEEHPSDNHGDKASFGYSNELISTNDLLKEIYKDEDIMIDEAHFIRARLFDMVIGDWDRHEDQWRWAKTKKDGKTIYKAVPRDRDQAFSVMGDGWLMKTGTTLIPTLRLLKSYDDELKNPKWFNTEPYPMDVAVLNQADKKVWDEQVKILREGLTDEIIAQAFKEMPKEVQDETLETIQTKLKGRLNNLQRISDDYYNQITKFVIIKGTQKDDHFVIERLPNITKVTAYRIKKGKKADVFHEREYSKGETKEIWIYALDDEDVFEVVGDGKNLIKVRLIGGQNNDKYKVENGKQVVIYDYKSKKNEFETNKGRKRLTDNYETNIYDYKKLKNNTNQLIPSIGFNPDDGIKIGVNNTYTTYGFERNPFTAQHKLSAGYFFATEGFNVNYTGEFANIIGDLNFRLDAGFASPSFAVNFFGFGNNTENLERDNDDIDFDFNRVRMQQFKVNPMLVWKGDLGGNFRGGILYESYEIENTTGRFINDVINNDGLETDNDFYGAEVAYQYQNHNKRSFPTLGMQTQLIAGYKRNTNGSNDFGYLIPELSFDHKIIPSGRLVLATKLRGHINIGNGFEFYQGANLGANTGLRGFRNERFTGKNSFVQTTDLRFRFNKVRRGVLPVNLGLFGGVDYGRVWLDDDNSDRWHNSYGGGVFADFAGLTSANFSLFNSTDGPRFSFGVGFRF